MSDTYVNDELAKATSVAQFRFALIAPVVQGLYSEASATEYYKRITEKPLTLPDGSSVSYSYKTIEKWTSRYKRGGFDALMPHTRSDKGTTRTLSDAAIEEIYKVKEKFPRLNATQIYNHLIENGFLSPKVNVSAVQRFIKRNDLKSARNPNVRDRKQFEEDAFGRMWQADTCYSSIDGIINNGKRDDIDGEQEMIRESVMEKIREHEEKQRSMQPAAPPVITAPVHEKDPLCPDRSLC